MYEASKAVMRRLHDSRFITRYFVGNGIDIGSGPDPLRRYAELFPLMKRCRDWDIADGDAQFLATIPDESLDFVHSSHCLEHMQNPQEALHHWLRVLKPGGHLVVTVPDEDLYEQGVFPSTFNSDHKWTFTMQKSRSWSPGSINLMALLAEFVDQAQTIKVEQLDATFHFHQPRFDQTSTPIGECALEFVLRKLPAEELARKGRYPDKATQVKSSVPIASHEKMPAEPPSLEDSVFVIKNLQQYQWKFVLGVVLIWTLINFNRYFGAIAIHDPISIARMAGETGGFMILGYIAWWAWATTKKVSFAFGAGKR
jgi:SAM-dependent methyltransferase